MNTWLAWLTAALGDVSPKVKAGLNWGTLAALALTLGASVTPDMLSGLGKFEPLAYAAIPLIASAVAAWLKSDPLRDLGKSAGQPAADATTNKQGGAS